MSIKRNTLFLFSILAHSFCLHAQNVDSLKSALKIAKNDTTRCKLLSELASYAPDDEWQGFNEQSKDLAEKNLKTCPPGHIHDLYQGYYADALDNCGSILNQRGDVAGALVYFDKAIKLYEELGSKKGLAGTLNKTALINVDRGDIATALKQFARSLKLREEIGDQDGIANSLNSIGFVYDKQGDAKLAMSYYERCLSILEKNGNLRGLSSCMGNISAIYYKKGEYAKTVEYSRKILKIRESIGDKFGMGVTLNNLAEVFDKLGQRDSAMVYIKKSLEIKEGIDDKKGIARSLNNMGMYYYEDKNNSKAIELLLKARQMAEKYSYMEDVQSSSGNLYKVYKSNGNYKDALESYETHILTRDSIASEVNKKAAIKHNLQYEYEKKAAADSVKNAEQEKVKNAQLKAQQLQLKQEKTQRFALYGGLLLVIVFAGFVFNRFKISQKQKLIIQQQKGQVDIAYDQLHEKNKEITDSINYAKRIQQAKLPAQKDIEQALPQSFILFKPKDIVSGDFYFFHKNKDSVFIAAADCTGHGVPGALMSMIGSEKLSDSVSQSSEPSEVLSLLNKGIKISLRQSGSDESTRDGMDIALCSVDVNKNSLKYSGANRPLWIIRKGKEELEETKATKAAIGGLTEDLQQFAPHEFKLQKGDTFYICTDGFSDQFNGKNGKKLMTKRFKEILLEIQDKSMTEQQKYLEGFVEDWKAGTEQIDDILVIGVRF